MATGSNRRFWLILLGAIAVHALLLAVWRTSLHAESAAWAEERTVTFVLAPPAAASVMPEDIMPEPLEEPPPETPIETDLPMDEIEELDPIEPLESILDAEPMDIELTEAKIDVRPMRHPPEPKPAPMAASDNRPPQPSAGPLVTYRAKIHELLERSRYYPYAALANGRNIKGEVTVRFIVLRDGSLDPVEHAWGRSKVVEVTASSGSSVLDAAAVRTVLRARKRFPAFPDALERNRLRVNFKFVFHLVDERKER